MQTSKKIARTSTKDKSKDDIPAKKKDDPLKRSIYSVSTPRNFIQKSTTADIYFKKNTPHAQVPKAPKKAPPSRITSKVATTNPHQPLKKDLFKSTSITSLSARSKLSKTDVIHKPVPTVQKSKITTTKTNKNLPINVTVNSPVPKRKLKLEEQKPSTDKDLKLKIKDSLQIGERQRTKTRTLDDDEVKVLTADVVDNNTEMAKLSKKLAAKPKAFYVNLNGDDEIDKKQSSEEEMNYEEDFESYESDFESYESTQSASSTEAAATEDEGTNNDEREESSKEERMLDSGHFDLRDTRSANKTTPMDFIVETFEEVDKKSSLTDEGFQEMSSSSGIPSMRTVHVDVLERTLFIDFSKSKENRRKRRIFERLKQRAADILNMVTLHEMTYSLFEMKPIPYDLFMATFGRSNYTQTAVQTFEDGISTEVQTEEVVYDHKWTQHPIKFSKNDVCLNLNTNIQNEKNENINLKFLFDEEKPKTKLDDEYRNNSLRIYLEQKDGVGSDKIMSRATYATTLQCNNVDMNKLGKFLKKVESKISNILTINTGNTDMSNLIKTSKYPFSSGYLSMSTNNLTNDKYSYLKNTDIIGVVFSKAKSNSIFTIHKKVISGVTAHKCVLCLWDLTVVIFEPIKILIATDNVNIGVFSGSTDGFFIGALEDGSIHIWDLTEEPTWCNDVSHATQNKNLLQEETENLSASERIREMNLKNLDVGINQDLNMATFRTSAFTTSAINMAHNDQVDNIVALEYLGVSRANSDTGNQKIIGQVTALQRLGRLTIWSVIQEKSKKYVHDPGKAYWSKLKLEKRQTIKLAEHIFERITEVNTFNLNTAKKRLATKRLERNNLKIECRPSSSNKIDRPTSAVSVKNSKILVENFTNVFDKSIVCSDLKIMNHNKCDYYLIAKNCGEVLCCTRVVSAIKVNSFNVSDPASKITSIAVSPHGLPYFLAATDTGTISMCSFDHFRVLLTLDCSNAPAPPTIEKYLSDHRGRFLGSLETPTRSFDSSNIKSLVWSPTDPFCVIAQMTDARVYVWELAHSDIHAKSVCVRAATACVVSDRALALITPENEVQVHKLTERGGHLELFQKYVTRL